MSNSHVQLLFWNVNKPGMYYDILYYIFNMIKIYIYMKRLAA